MDSKVLYLFIRTMQNVSSVLSRAGHAGAAAVDGGPEALPRRALLSIKMEFTYFRRPAEAQSVDLCSLMAVADQHNQLYVFITSPR